MPIDDLQLPKGIEVIADEIGIEAALALVDRYGGTMNVYIPQVADRKHAWAQVIGLPNWRKMCKKWGGLRLSLPRGAFIHLKKKAIIELDQLGYSRRQIALKVRCTERYVYEVLQDMPPAENQMKLPFS